MEEEMDMVESKNPEEDTSSYDIPGFKSLEEYLQTAYPIVATCLKASNKLPSSKEFSYYRTHPQFVNIMKADGMRLENLMSCILRRNGIQRTDEGISSIIDSNDRCLDRAYNNLLEMDGRKRNPLDIKPPATSKVSVPSGGWHDSQSSIEPSKGEVVLCASVGISRPQLLFKDKIDNSNSPWCPRIKEKPNSLKPLSILLDNKDGQECYTHPYEYELMLWKPNDDQLTYIDVRNPLPLSDTPYVYVETEEQLNDLLSDLLKVNELAVDLEHHSYRSFMGFTCLMQISTWEKDYIIDTLKLRDKLYILNEVFTKPTVLKVFHGADSDIEWLQRDLSLYVVNMFDTFQASKLLEFSRLSLAYLLYRYCQVVANKEYQRYDWRRRPLPEHAIAYARGDTHYLLHIYQRMRNELLDKSVGKPNLLKAVYERSKDTCRKVYIKPCLEEDSYMTVYRKEKLSLDNQQLYALKEMYKWRDVVARQEDESTGYILPNHMMAQICKTLPREMQGILACCNPIPPFVRTCLLELHNIVLRAKEQSLVKTYVTETVKSEPLIVRGIRNIYSFDNSGQDFRDDLPTLLGGTLTLPTLDPQEKVMPIIKIFQHMELNNVKNTPVKINFISPYQRYLKVIPYARQLEKEEQERLEKEEEERLNNSLNDLGSVCSENVERATAEKEPSPEPLAKNRGYMKRAKTDQGKNRTDNKKDTTKEVPRSEGIGIVGGEVQSGSQSLNKKNSPTNKIKKEIDKDGWTVSENGNYDFSKVDFNKFQSGGQTNKKRHNEKKRSQFKRRNKNSQDMRQLKKHCGGI